MTFFDLEAHSSSCAEVPRWTECGDPNVFDNILACFAGHPLQSAFWGNARKKVDGVSQLLLQYQTKAGNLTGLARIEERTVPLLNIGKIAWLPKGPVLDGDGASIAEAALLAELKRRGFMVCITDCYAASQIPHSRLPRTIWLDLTLGLDVLSKALDSQWRYGVKRALREGVLVRSTTKLADVSAFFRLCNFLSVTKGFLLPGSEALMTELICVDSPSSAVGMTLYVGEIGGELAGGAVVARSGRHLHYFWGASDRRYSKYRVSEAIHWQVIQDGVASGVERYDLEGIDPVGNPGVTQFKRKMGGTELVLQGKEVTPLSWAGRLAVGVGRRLGRLG